MVAKAGGGRLQIWLLGDGFGTQPVWVPHAVVLGGAPKRRHRRAAVTFGEWSRFVLGSTSCPCSFFLQAFVPLRRIFMDLDAGVLAIYTPSGVRGARIRRLAVGGEDEGPDCFCSFLSKVLFVKSEDLIVISFLFEVLDVKACTPLG